MNIDLNLDSDGSSSVALLLTVKGLEIKDIN